MEEILIQLHKKKWNGRQYRDIIVGKDRDFFVTIINKPYINKDQLDAFEAIGIHWERVEDEKEGWKIK